MRRSEEKNQFIRTYLVSFLASQDSGKSETTEYDQTRFEQYAEFVVQNFRSDDNEQLDSFSDMRDLQLIYRLWMQDFRLMRGLPYNDQLTE